MKKSIICLTFLVLSGIGFQNALSAQGAVASSKATIRVVEDGGTGS